MKKTNGIWIFSILCLVILIIHTSSCSSSNEPNPVVIAILTTSTITNITQTSAISGGNVTSDGGAVVTARGVCWSTSATPTISDVKTHDDSGTGIFESTITGLRINTEYHVRAYATNSAGTGYGNDISFTTLTGEPLADIDGNLYNTVTIGTQEWMVENLKVIHYNDGTEIPLVTDNTTWSNLTTAGYSWYTNDEITYKNTYGALYNGYAVNTEKLCPTGWHVPAQTEWETLTNYVFFDVGKLTESGTAHWQTPTGATNQSGFTALPGGNRFIDGSFGNIGVISGWWSSTNQVNSNDAWSISFVGGGIGTGYDSKVNGNSIRCIKN